MREAFEQLIERQTCEHLEDWQLSRQQTVLVRRSTPAEVPADGILLHSVPRSRTDTGISGTLYRKHGLLKTAV